jgi:phage shock protein A
MFRAISRYLRALGYLFTGQIDEARRALSMSPEVIQATFDHVIREKTARIQQYKEAVGSMIAQQERKKVELKRQSEEVTRLGKLREGATVMAKKIVERHGGNADAVRQDPEYAKCQAAFKDFSSTLAEKEARCKELEGDIGELDKNIAGHKVQLEGLLRELEQVRAEKHDTVADVISARQEREVADMVAGISQDRTAEELQDLRQMRDQAKATARVSRELAGTDAKRSEQEFLQYAEQSTADKEFDALVGLARKTETPEAAPPTKIPEK